MIDGMTVALVLALAAALTWGISDFVGGFAARAATPWAVVVAGQIGGGLTMLAVALASPGRPEAHHLGWAALAGAGSAVGTVHLYRGLASGRSSLVAPLSAVGATAVPVLAAVALGGDRPTALVWAGIVAALPGIWLVATTPTAEADAAGHDTDAPGRTTAGPHTATAAHAAAAGRENHVSALRDGVFSGLGFGVMLAAVGQIPASAGFLPLALQNVVACAVTIAAATVLRQSWLPATRRAWAGLPTGVLGATGTAVFMTATQAGSLSVASVLASLYPVFTIALSMVFLRERVGRVQAAGVVLCGVAVALIATG